MTTFRRICVPTDLSSCSERALALAARLAHEHGAQLHLLHVLPDASHVAEMHQHPDLRAESRGVDAFLAQLGGETPPPSPSDPLDGLDVIRTHRIGDVPAEICDYARSQGIDLLVLGTHSRSGLSRLFAGSVAEAVVREAVCPVMVLPQAAERVLEDEEATASGEVAAL